VASHWVVKTNRGAKIVVMILFVAGSGLIGVVAGVVASLLLFASGFADDPSVAITGTYVLVFMSLLFSILGAALGGYVGYRITRKFK